MKGATIIRLSEYERTCRNCEYYTTDICTYPGGWTLDKKNRGAQFARKKQKQEGDG